MSTSPANKSVQVTDSAPRIMGLLPYLEASPIVEGTRGFRPKPLYKQGLSSFDLFSTCR